MKPISIALVLIIAAAPATGQRDTYVGSGHVDTASLSLLAKDLKAPSPEPTVYAVPRAADITLSQGVYPADRTDLIATVSDQQRVLRSLHIDPAPQPPKKTETSAKEQGRPLGNAAQKH